MTTTYEVADMMIGVRNMIEAADLRRGDQVLLLADTRSDKMTLEALTAGLRFFGAEPGRLSPNRSRVMAMSRQRCCKRWRYPTWSFGSGRCSSRSHRRIARWAAKEKRAA